MRVFRFATYFTLCAMVALFGCGETAFSPHFRDNRLEDLKKAIHQTVSQKGEAQKALDEQPLNSLQKPLLFLVSPAPTKLMAFDLDAGKIRWTVDADVTSKVVSGRSLLFYRAGKEALVARNIVDGTVAWQTELLGGDRLIGMAVDEHTDQLVYVTERMKPTFSGISAYLVSVSPKTGAKLWMHESRGRLGAPVMQANRVYLPFRFQSISILNTKDGRELARLRSKDQMLVWTRKSGDTIYYGTKNGIYTLDEKSISGTQSGSTYISALLPESIKTGYWLNGYNAAFSAYTAFDRNRLHWRLARSGSGSNQFMNDTVYLHAYRFFFAFDTRPNSVGPNTKGSRLKWVFSVPRKDVVASEFTGHALVLASDKGDIMVVDPKTGALVRQIELNTPLYGVTFDVGSFAAPSPSNSPGKVQTMDIRDELREIIWDPDRRFRSVKLFCVEELAKIPGKATTQDLLKIVTHHGIESAVYERAGEMLVARQDKEAVPLYLNTLKNHYSFSEGGRPLGVDILAKALAGLKVKEATPSLIDHLNDHETQLKTLEPIISALVLLGDKAILEPFRNYLLFYHADPLFKKNMVPLTMISDALYKIGGDEEQMILNFVADDPHTLKPLKDYLVTMMRQKNAAKVSSAQTTTK